MQIFPAIDLRGGQVVRLYQGDYDQETVYAADPCAVARDFRAAGARYLHVVDLDGAKDGTLANFESIAALVRQGIRTACLPRGKGEPYNGTLSLLAQIKKNPSRLKQRLGHRISYSVVGEPIRRHLYVYAIISAAASRQLFARLRRYPFQIYVF